ncbi:uncharacterized protein LOC124776917 isoform X1 [Schistocerca piceifrons]|uniref:uncharacterized protein LOC124776917 isoform X1 n=1 Tax=Schistocerca piceifrons TaxID=274613 RepID=UPI001F5F73E7|nr:uncharacterized protein LOC124776917 isoform X1 [Schistocerca piceifrons]
MDVQCPQMKRFRLVTCLLLVAAGSALLEMRTNPSEFSALQSAVINVDHQDLFRFICHTDTVEMWFEGLSHFRSADMKPLGVGKLYQAIYKVPFLGDYVILLRTTEYVPDMRIVLESESFLKPRIEISAFPVSSRGTRLTFRLTFQRKSLLFQHTLGSLLHYIAQKYIENSLSFLIQL